MAGPNFILQNPWSNAAASSPDLGRNDPCWCGSGKKFKVCHLGRAEAAAPNFHAHAANMRDDGKRGRCLHPQAGGGNCGGTSIASHTVQRNGGLAAIAEDGHVLTTFVNFADIDRADGKPEPKRIGLKQASTFPGFCATHDGALFGHIEGQSLAIGGQAAFLFHYRAICLELFRKRAVIASLPKIRELDAGRGLSDQLGIQAMLTAWSVGLETGLSDLEAVKSRMDEKLLAADWSGASFCAVEFDTVLPVAAAFAMHPEFNWQMEQVQDISDLEHSPDEVSITLTSYEGRSSAIFAWCGEASGPRRSFVESFLAIDDVDKASRLISGCFELAENTYIRPSWWAALDGDTKASLSDKIWHGTAHRPRPRERLQDKVPLAQTPAVLNVAVSWE